MAATGGERVSLDDPAAVAEAVERHVPHRCFDTIHLAFDDPGSLIASIAPPSLDDVCAGELWAWDLTVHGVFVEAPTDTTVEVPWEVIGDGAVVLSAGLLLVEPY